ncbi:MAG: hypothetical protein ACQEP8_00125 [Chlamydiota bacterium]
MIDTHCRSPYQNLLVNPAVNLLARCHLTPNFITFIATLSGVMVLPLLYYHLKWAALYLPSNFRVL